MTGNLDTGPQPAVFAPVSSLPTILAEIHLTRSQAGSASFLQLHPDGFQGFAALQVLHLMRRADGQKDDHPVIFVATIHSRHTWRIFLHMSCGDVVQDTRIPVGMKRFANAGRNGNFQHSHFIVFKQELVILWRCGESVVFGCPPFIEVTCALSEQESRAKRTEQCCNLYDPFDSLSPTVTLRMILAISRGG